MKRILFSLLLAVASLTSLDHVPPVNTISVSTMRNIVEFMRSYYRYHDTLKGRALFDTIENEVSFGDAIAVLKAADYLGLKPLVEFAARLVVTRMPSREELATIMGDLVAAGIDQIGRYYFLLTGENLVSEIKLSGYSVQDYLDYRPHIIALKTQGYRLDLAHLHLRSLDGITKIPHLDTFRFLELNHNILTQIEPGALKEFASVILLHAHYNKFTTLDSDTFCGMKALKTIRLENNALESVDPAVFACLPALQAIIIQNNKLSQESITALQKALPHVAIGL